MAEQTYIIQCSLLTKEPIKKWESIDQILEQNPTFKKHFIKFNLDGKTKMAHGFIWVYYTHLPEIYKRMTVFTDFDISNHGNVKNNKTGEELEQFADNDGYFFVMIHEPDTKYRKSKREGWYIHILVADTFLGNLCYYPYVVTGDLAIYHKDGNIKNNWSNNLTFDPPAYILTKTPINQIDLATGKIIRTFPSYKQVLGTFKDMTEIELKKACDGATSSCRGFKWVMVLD